MGVRGSGSRSRGFTVVDVLVALALVGLLISGAVWMFAFGGRATRRLTPQLSLQQNSRKAIARLLREIQEGMEVLEPQPGQTLSYALIADKLAQGRMFYLEEQAGQTPPTFNLYRVVDGVPPPGDRKIEQLLTGIRRLTFTSTSEGALQVNLLLAEEEAEYSMLTTVRLRNLPSSEEMW